MGKLLSLAMLVLVVGCGNGDAAKMAGDGPLPTWEALNNFRTGPEMAIGYPAAAEDWKGVKKAASSPDFQAAVAELESSKAPGAYTKHDDFVKSLKALVETAQNGSEEEVKAKYLAFKQAGTELSR